VRNFAFGVSGGGVGGVCSVGGGEERQRGGPAFFLQSASPMMYINPKIFMNEVHLLTVLTEKGAYRG